MRCLSWYALIVRLDVSTAPRGAVPRRAVMCLFIVYNEPNWQIGPMIDSLLSVVSSVSTLRLRDVLK